MRAALPEAAREEERESNTERRREMRAALPEAAREEERESNTERRREMRATLPEAARDEERAQNTARRRELRVQTSERSSAPAVYLGQMSVFCPYCQALKFPEENLNCCHNGKVSLECLDNYSISINHAVLCVVLGQSPLSFSLPLSIGTPVFGDR